MVKNSDLQRDNNNPAQLALKRKRKRATNEQEDIARKQNQLDEDS